MLPSLGLAPPATAALQEQLDRRTRELHEALERQAATDEVLRAISRSPGKLEPVFDAMLDNATRICGAQFGILFKIDNGAISPLSLRGVPEQLSRFLTERGSRAPPPGTTMERLIRTRQAVHVEDLARQDGLSSPTSGLGGARTYLGIPMLKDNELVGAFNIYRQEVRPFTEKQIELVQNFAAQAVIAIENTRLLNELRQRTDDLTESLEQQTATSEVLKVISSSPGDLKPVFQAMLANATRICGARFGVLFRINNGEIEPGALHDAPKSLERHLSERGQIRAFRPGSTMERAVQSKDAIHVVDVRQDIDAANNPAAKYGGARTLLTVPMLKEGEPIGFFNIYRDEVRPFTGKQIELVQNFAAQAVIAIENTRLLNELRKSACSSRPPPPMC